MLFAGIKRAEIKDLKDDNDVWDKPCRSIVKEELVKSLGEIRYSDPTFETKRERSQWYLNLYQPAAINHLP